jgi:hypothetical protein
LHVLAPEAGVDDLAAIRDAVAVLVLQERISGRP